MNTRMLLTAVLRNRRSQWTLVPKATIPGAEATADEVEVAPSALHASSEPLAASGREPASGNG